MENKNEFKPYVPAEKVTPELTVTSVIIGVLLSVVFGAANAYLGLKVGMTVSASIPAAVIAMGVIRVILKKNSILESNVVQTIGSAGESLAAGAIFTLPALYMWASNPATGIKEPDLITITLIALVGGLLGVFFMVPLRNALIVKEHGTLPYPEGTACAEVLLAGENGGASAGTVFAGMGLAALFKFITSGIKAVPESIMFKVKNYAGSIGSDISPALLSVGYICGPRISSYMFSGSVLAWFVLIPLIVLFGGNALIFPATQTVGEVYAASGASGVWSSYVRYIGAGALAAGGIISLVKSMPMIARTFVDTIKSLKGQKEGGSERTNRELSMIIVLAGIAILTLAIWLIPAIPVTLIGALIVVVFGFFFAAVSSRMVGIVGSSNNPVSGMAIATVLITTLILSLTGLTGAAGMTAAISIGSIICIVSAIAGDTSQDLKTGYILGSTPKKQQIGEIIGVVAAALAIGGTLMLLNKAYTFDPNVAGSLQAPQATIMKLIVEGVMSNELPWDLIFIGVAIAVIVEVLRIPVLPFAIGVYLPISLNTCIMAGGLIRLAVDKCRRNEEEKRNITNSGILYCSGMIAGEGIMGLILAIVAITGVDKIIDLSGIYTKLGVPGFAHNIIGLVFLAVMIFTILKATLLGKSKKN